MISHIINDAGSLHPVSHRMYCQPMKACHHVPCADIQAGLIEMPKSADLESSDFIYFKEMFVIEECFT